MSHSTIQTKALMALFYTPTAAPFEGLDTKQNTIPSIMPRIFDRALDLLVSGAREHKGLVTAFAPAATNYLMTVDDASLSQAICNSVVDHARSLKAKGVKIVMTDLLGDRWAAIPRLINGPTAPLESSVYTGQEQLWNHKENPTIYVSTTIDVILSEATESEMSHVLLKAFAMAIHELAHLLPRFLYSTVMKETPETMHAPTFLSALPGQGEGGECAEEIAFGGMFTLPYDGSSVPHGTRLQGRIRNSHRLFVARDARVLDVLAVLTADNALVKPSSLRTIAFPCFPTEASLLPTCSQEYWRIFPHIPDRLPRTKFTGVPLVGKSRENDGKEGKPADRPQNPCETKEKDVEQSLEQHPPLPHQAVPQRQVDSLIECNERFWEVRCHSKEFAPELRSCLGQPSPSQP